MPVRVPEDFRDKHRPRITKRLAGGGWGGHPAYYLYTPRCSCGWQAPPSNYDRVEAKSLHREHLVEQYEQSRTSPTDPA